MDLEQKFCADAPRITVTDDHVVEGYASLFGKTDQGGDTVRRGAYAACLAKLKASDGRVRMLWQHDPAQPIGIWDEVYEDPRGLYVKGRLLPDVTRAREAAALIEAGALDGLSIGYRTKTAEAQPNGRVLTEVELWEVSLVTFPMQTEARVAAKSETPQSDAEAETEAAVAEMARAFTEARAALAGRQ